MINYGNAVVMPGTAGNCATNLQSVFSAKLQSQEEESMEYSTIDGEVINSMMGSDAVKKGKGLFIGEYFVGILDSLSGMGTTPYLRY
jgi:hypothetical protein